MMETDAVFHLGLDTFGDVTVDAHGHLTSHAHSFATSSPRR